MIAANKLGVHTGGADWSELMSDLHKVLARAERQLRLIHMGDKYKHEAVGHLTVARAVLSQLERWCQDNGGRDA